MLFVTSDKACSLSIQTRARSRRRLVRRVKIQDRFSSHVRFKCKSIQISSIFNYSPNFSFNDDALVLDKTGRIQRFNKNGEFVEQSAAIDAYLGNGFVVRGDQAVIACSGIVLDSVFDL